MTLYMGSLLLANQKSWFYGGKLGYARGGGIIIKEIWKGEPCPSNLKKILAKVCKKTKILKAAEKWPFKKQFLSA